MIAKISPHVLSGVVRVPSSKSHTIRRLLIASLADGISVIDHPLDSLDALSCVNACRVLGAVVEERRGADGKSLAGFTVTGSPGFASRSLPAGRYVIDVGNSGTTLFLALALAALLDREIEFTGDEQIRRRSAGPLLDALRGLGADVKSAPGGCAPVTVKGPWKGGKVSVSCPTSQYLSALLLAAPLAPEGVLSEIEVPLLNERPYIEMTLSYLDAQNIPYKTDASFSRFVIPGGAAWKPVNEAVPGDFSSAAFPACGAVISGGELDLPGLDPNDTQGDKAVFGFLETMGAGVNWIDDGAGGRRLWVSRKGALRGGEFDLNATPDLLPVMAVLAAYAEGDTALVNVAHARIKETDRIAVMAGELARLGVKTGERPDGLVIHGKGAGLGGGRMDSHGDHRIAMAFAAGALGAAGPVEIEGAECAAVTYPGFLELLDGSVVQ
jgi:3-phosphoshikimate 1-carboxyvinyltransferase